jgi:uridine kinase
MILFRPSRTVKIYTWVFQMTLRVLLFLFVGSCCYADGPLIVGIAGGSGSGKTTLALAVQQAIGNEECAVIHADDYYKPLSDIPSADILDFDSPKAIDFELMYTHLLALRTGKSIHVPSYDFSLSDRIGTQQVDPKKIILVEGFLLFLVPEIRSQLDMTVFLEVDEDLLCLRRIERDLLVLNRPFSQIKENYLAHVKPGFEKFVAPTKQYAKLIVNANLSQSDVVERVVEEIAGRVDVQRSN